MPVESEAQAPAADPLTDGAQPPAPSTADAATADAATAGAAIADHQVAEAATEMPLPIPESDGQMRDASDPGTESELTSPEGPSRPPSQPLPEVTT
jgi:hypothetical protein